MHNRRSGILVGGGFAALLAVVVIAWAPWRNEALSPPDRGEVAAARRAAVRTSDPEPDPVSARVAVVTDGGKTLIDRLEGVRRLPRTLTAGQVAALREVLEDRDANETLRNDILSALEQQTRPPAWLGESLLAMWRDAEESRRWRDYCLQHMKTVHASAGNRDDLEAALVAAAREPSGPGENYAGTALLSLERIGEESPEARAHLRREAAETVSVIGGALDEEKAVTALQVLEDEDASLALEKARAVVADEDRLVRLRLSAMSILGRHGGEADGETLEALTTHEDKRIRRVARTQLEALRDRLDLSEEAGDARSESRKVSSGRGLETEGEEG